MGLGAFPHISAMRPPYIEVDVIFCQRRSGAKLILSAKTFPNRRSYKINYSILELNRVFCVRTDANNKMLPT